MPSTHSLLYHLATSIGHVWCLLRPCFKGTNPQRDTPLDGERVGPVQPNSAHCSAVVTKQHQCAALIGIHNEVATQREQEQDSARHRQKAWQRLRVPRRGDHQQHCTTQERNTYGRKQPAREGAKWTLVEFAVKYKAR